MSLRFGEKRPLPLGFLCEDSIRPHLEKVFAGEYDVPLSTMKPLRILDLGANCGAFSLWALERWPDSTVFAYEPHPKTFAVLEANVWGKSVICANWGIGKRTGWVPLWDGEHSSGEASIYSNGVSTGTGVHVEIRSPESLPEADIIKLDVEGCEPEILRPLIEGGRKFLAIMFEFHCEEHRRELDALLKDYILVGGAIQPHGRIGTANYIHRELDALFEGT